MFEYVFLVDSSIHDINGNIEDYQIKCFHFKSIIIFIFFLGVDIRIEDRNPEFLIFICELCIVAHKTTDEILSHLGVEVLEGLGVCPPEVTLLLLGLPVWHEVAKSELKWRFVLSHHRAHCLTRS